MNKKILEKIINETDKGIMMLGAMAGTTGSAIYATFHNIHSWEDWGQIGMRWGSL